MLALLSLVHAALAVVLLAGSGLATRERSGLVRLVSAAGAAAALGLFLARGSDLGWGAQRMDAQGGALVAVSIFCAWLLVAAIDRGAGRWDVGALVGAGSAALVLLASGRWVAPALLFWGIVSACALVAGWTSSGRSFAWLAVGVSDVCVVGALVGHSLNTESWRMPDELPVWATAVVTVGIVLRVGVLPRVGIWSLAAGIETALLPLVIGSGFALVPTASSGDDVAVALPLLLLGLGAVGWSVGSGRLRSSVIAPWIASVLLAVVWIEPRSLGRAAATVAVAVSAVALWPWTSGRGQAERALLLGAVPATIGFGAILAGAVASFERVTTAASVAGSAPWFAFAALLPVALAAGVTLAASTARRTEPERFEPTAVLAMWVLAIAGLVLGLSPTPELGFASVGARSTALYLVAAAAGLLAARIGPRQIALMTPAPVPEAGTFSLPGMAGVWLSRFALLLALLTLAATLWFTYAGLKVGFL